MNNKKLELDLERHGYCSTNEGKGWAKGKTKYDDIRIYACSMARKGKKLINLTMKDKIHPPISKKKISEKIIALWGNPSYRDRILEKMRNPQRIEKIIKNLPTSDELKNLWETKEYREKVITNSLKGLMKPTSLEKNFMQTCNKNDIPFKYVGDGSFLIGWKNPGFISTNGKKICIEVSNSFFKNQDYKEIRIKHFAKYGWKCIVLFENDLQNEMSVLKKIEEGGE